MQPLATFEVDSATQTVTSLSLSSPQYWLSWCQET